MQTVIRRTLSFAVAGAVVAALVATPAGAATSDAQIAKAGTIVASDLPATWTSTAPDNSSNKQVEKIAAKIPSCKSYLAFTKANKGTTNAESRDFLKGDQDLSNKAFVYERNAGAVAAMRAIGATNVAACLTTVFQKVLDAEIASDPASRRTVTSATAKIEPVTGLSGIGDDAVGYAGGLDIQLTDGTAQQLILGVLAIRNGRAVTTFSFSTPPNESTFSTVVDNAVNASVTRTQDALG